MRSNFKFTASHALALLTAGHSLFGCTFAEIRIDDINKIPANNDMPNIADIFVSFPVLFDTQVILPNFEIKEDVIILTTLIPDRTSPRIPLNVYYSASSTEWTGIADWTIEAGASEARRTSRPRRLIGDDDVTSGSSSSSSSGSSSGGSVGDEYQPSGKWMINFAPHDVNATDPTSGETQGNRGIDVSHTMEMDIVVTDPDGYRSYVTSNQKLYCTDLGPNGLFCQEFVIELDEAADDDADADADADAADAGADGVDGVDVTYDINDTDGY